MRASTVNLARGLFMLGCLIVLPAIAVFGLPISDQVASLLSRFGQVPGGEVSRSGPPEEPSAGPETSVYAGGTDPGTSVSPGGNVSNSIAEPSPQMAFDPNLFPASCDAPIYSPRSPDSEKGVGFFRGIQERLRDLGATYYRLESWGEGGEFFHFQCRVAVDGHTNFTRHFEATGDDPLNAMDAVLREIEGWKERSGPMETGAYSR